MDNKKSILVMDDHDSIRFLLGSFLSKRYKVITKKDGFEGLCWMSQGNIPDLILLDMSMPRLCGFEFLANVRSSGFFRDISVIVVTGFEDSIYEELCRNLGVDGFIRKPFNPILLNEKIDSILNTLYK